MNEPFEAVLSDMDGVLTDTAGTHRKAWKQTFDAFLTARGGQRPFSDDDYRDHVDGKPRYAGVRDFLTSRGIELPEGDDDDPPERETVRGLGNAKNRRFLELLGTVGVTVFADAAAAIARWRRGGIRLAAFTASRNGRRVLSAAGLDDAFDVVFDGEDAARCGFDGKREILRATAEQLGVAPARAVVLEDAIAGVEAGAATGFGLVVGVSRREAGDAGGLDRAGAGTIVRDLFRLRFPRRLPRALDRLDEIARWRGDRPLALFLDFDGTLAPIVDDPDDARLSDAMRAMLQRIAAKVTVAVVSGRDRADVARRVGLDDIVIVGNHGFDIEGRGVSRTLAEAEPWIARIDAAERELAERVGELPGVGIERKRFSVAVHVRRVDSDRVRECAEQAVDAVRRDAALRVRHGKEVFELEPPVDWNKGRALDWIQAALPSTAIEGTFPIYIGDDETDEDAFAALCGRGAGIHVGPEIADSRADYRAADPDEVRAVLEALVAG